MENYNLLVVKTMNLLVLINVIYFFYDYEKIFKPPDCLDCEIFVKLPLS